MNIYFPFLFQELSVFQDSIQTLQIAKSKFVESGESLEKITPAIKGKTILVPLTGSMYVPGTVADVDNVVIDIGTGYYAQKDIDGGKDYFKRKVEFVAEQMEKINLLGMEKSKLRQAVGMIMEMKFQSELQAQKAPAS
ncbi:hypothetical protein O3G_MSEX008101 [Manduca sexta]|uniref:Prefoldin subunit 5 n=1 Tax=Manduca sexta TaxID=7130 RepID=A0A921Z8T5_MANSE|nr:hypothetical protein O3G_MSEX008101 [Manduca sexta]